jgi:hypothetical protein
MPPEGTKHARMIRKQPVDSKPGRRLEDPKAAYSKEQLQEVGAVTLIWNQVDVFLDWLLWVALNLPFPVGLEVTSRMSGIEAKVDILRKIARRAELLNEEARAAIKQTLDGVIECKRYRDNIVHSVPYDIDKGIAHRRNRRAELHQSLVTLEALTGLYERIRLLLDELREVDLLHRLADKAGAMVAYGEEEFDLLDRRRMRNVSLQTSQLADRQKVRLALKPLVHSANSICAACRGI